MGKEFEQAFLQNKQVAKIHMRKCSISLVIRQVKLKMTRTQVGKPVTPEESLTFQ